MTPKYLSFDWLDKDYRFLKLVNNKIVYSDTSCVSNTVFKSGKKRYSLPFWVIKNLLRHAPGTQLLKNDIKKHEKSNSQTINYNDEILQLIHRANKRKPRPKKKYILVRVEKDKLIKNAIKKPSIKIDKNIYTVICKNPELKKRFKTWCKSKQTLRG